MKRKRPPKQRDDSPHIHALHAYADNLELATHSGVAWLIDGFPELAELHYAVAELLHLADARSGAKWDESRVGSPDYISSDGRSTAAGRGTYAARGRLDYWRRRVAGLVEALKSDLDPMSKPHGDARPRCGKRKCDGRGRRQPVGVKFCGFCGETMSAS